MWNYTVMLACRIVLVCFTCSALLNRGYAQDQVVVIRADNFARLAPANFIPFSNIPEEIGEIRTGWFAVSDDGRHIAAKSLMNTVVVWNIQGNLIDTFSLATDDGLPATIYNARFATTNKLLVVYSDGRGGVLAERDVVNQTISVLRLPFVPAHAWQDSSDYWLENVDERCTIRLDQLLSDTPQNAPSCTVSSPEAAQDVMVRIGRVLPPYAVTASKDGQVQRWNLESGEVEFNVLVDPALGVPVFGQINSSGSHLAWRDPESTALYLLAFNSGSNQRIAQLDGQYIPFILLTPSADVIIGVGAGGQSSVTAWDVETGEAFMLGEFEGCSRPPDEVRLSADGTTMIIGCDGGLNVWQIAGDQP